MPLKKKVYLASSQHNFQIHKYTSLPKIKKVNHLLHLDEKEKKKKLQMPTRTCLRIFVTYLKLSAKVQTELHKENFCSDECVKKLRIHDATTQQSLAWALV